MGCEKACSSTCSLCFKLNCCPEDRPSPIFLTYTLLINIPLGILALVLGITAFVNNVTDNPGCNFFVHPGTWLLIAVALSAFFCLFALRIYQTFRKTATPDIEAGASYEQCVSFKLCISGWLMCAKHFGVNVQTGSQHKHDPLINGYWYLCRRTRRTFTGKLYHTCCHDVGTFLYFFVAPFTVVWAILGLARDGLDGCDESDWGVRLTSVVLLLYLGCTVFVACISCFWEMNRMANGMVAEQEQDRRHQAGPSALQEQLVATQQQYVAAPFVNHMFGPGFVNGPGAFKLSRFELS